MLYRRFHSHWGRFTSRCTLQTLKKSTYLILLIFSMKIRPTTSVNKILKIENSQYDSQEFLNDLLQLLSNELNINYQNELATTPRDIDDIFLSSQKYWKDYLYNECSIIESLFSGQFKSRISCSSCNNERNIFECFQLIQLGIPTPNTK